MKLQGGVRAIAFLVLLYGATYTLSEPPPVRSFALLAQASVPGQIKEQCRKGYEYWVGYQGSDLGAVITKKPPAGVKPEALPPGIVRYSDGRGGYISLICKEGQSVGSAIPAGSVSYFGTLNPGNLPTAVPAGYTNNQTGSFSNSLYTDSGAGSFDSGSGSLVPGGALQNIPYQNGVSTEGVQLSPDFTPTYEQPSIGDIDKQIQNIAQQNIEADPALRDNAFQMRLCQEQGTCEMGRLESDNPFSLEQQLRQEAQSAVRHEYNKAISSAYGPGYAVEGLGDNSVARVSQNDWGARYYDSETGEAFLARGAGESGPTILANTGGVPTSGPIGEWAPAMQSTIDSPQKFQAFENEYFDNGTEPKSFELKGEDYSTEFDPGKDYVVARDAIGHEKIIPRDAYNAVRLQGDISTGAADTVMRIQETTAGKVGIDAPWSFPQETGVGVRGNPDVLTQLSSGDRAAALSTLDQELQKYPSEYWQNAKSVDVFTYGPVAPTPVSGWSNNYTGRIWLDGSLAGSNPVEYATTINHELTHYNDQQLFGSNEQWGKSIYGAQYGDVYAGKTGQTAVLTGKFERQEGFVDEYGAAGGLKEDQATVVESMFRNYGAVETAIQTDGTLAAKVALAKQGFSNMSNGIMNDAYWQNLKPIDPTFTLPPTPAPSFFSGLIKALPFGIGGR